MDVRSDPSYVCVYVYWAGKSFWSEVVNWIAEVVLVSFANSDWGYKSEYVPYYKKTHVQLTMNNALSVIARTTMNERENQTIDTKQKKNNN